MIISGSKNIGVLIEYNRWANYRALDSIKKLTIENKKPMSIFSHIILSEELWLKRIKNAAPGIQKFWDLLTADECSDLIEKNELAWSKQLKGKSDEEWKEKITYTNSKGFTYTNSLYEICIHVFNHSAYHRGQIATLVRQAGGEPAVTDFIVFIRE